jgi:hypothetical protein
LAGSNAERSPGFLERGETRRSFELKFLVDPDQARRIRDWAGGRLAPDPWTDPALDGAYLVHTLYLDTAALDVFHGSESFRRRKFRVRRYGDETSVQLEQKTRSGDRVAKRRTPFEASALEALGGGLAARPSDAAWFQHRVRTRGLAPVVRISYLRYAFVAAGTDGPLRLTMDDRIEAAGEDRWNVESVRAGSPVLSDRRVLELKFRREMPLLFKDLIATFGLAPASLSKYRNAVRSLRLDRGSAGDA